MRVLDLFCGAGGASRGYELAGATSITGVDIETQPRYPYRFIKGDALAFLDEYAHEIRGAYDFIHASPPCQAFSDLQKRTGLEYPQLIEPTRTLLLKIGLPYVIENVEGAPLLNPVKLCGASDEFPELRVIRHRLFESNVPLVGTSCPKKHPLVFTYDKRKAHYGFPLEYVQVTGGGNCTVARAKAAMGIDWMTKKELNEAIPPAYAEFIGKQVFAYVNGRVPVPS